MSDRKLDLPDDLLSSKLEPSVGSIQEKVLMGSHDESKDQVASDSSIPLSPQWLYSKPSDSKMMDMRSPTSLSLGNSNDPSQKDGWRLDAPEDKKDWRKIVAENETNRRWREEERETGLLGARRDRRKTERRADSGSMRDTMDGRNLPSSDRWHDGGNRNTGHEARRDSKWSSRWGPDDKEKEARTEKKTDMEKEREDAQTDTHSSVVGNRLPSERDSESRGDKWRPRHRMEVHSSGSGPSSYRAAPGFGLERGRVEGSNTGGFAAGRGRSDAIGRSSSIGGGLTVTAKGGSVIGKPNLTTVSFCYPRAKLLDIYRCKKLESSLLSMPNEMEETPAITQVDFVEPLAFVPPDALEDAILSDIWKGKVTSSEVIYNSFKKGRSTENLSVGSNELTETALGPANEVTAEDAIYDSNKSNGDFSWNNSQLTALNDSMVNYQGRVSQLTTDGLTEHLGKNDSVYGNFGSTAASQVDSIESSKMLNPSMTTLKKFDDIDSATSLGVGLEICKDLSSLALSCEQKQDSGFPLSGIHNETDDLERTSPFDDMYFYYIDPQGYTQGPFQGADIISWFEQGYFGLDLPVQLADAPEGTRFQNLGDVMPHLKLRGGNLSSELGQPGAFGRKLEPSVATISDGADPSLADNLHHLSSELNSSVQHAQSRASDSEVLLHLPHSDGQRFHDFVAQDEEVVFPGRLGNAASFNEKPSGNELDPFAVSIGQSLLSGDLREPSQSDSKLHPFGLLWSELQGSHARYTESSDMAASLGRVAPFGGHPDPASVAEKWSDSFRQDTHTGRNIFPDAAAGHSLPNVEQETNRFDLAEQLMLQQIQQQQQLQQRNAMASPAYLNESLIERMPSQLHHQQLANPSARDIEHLMAMQLQHQREIQLHQQQLQRHQFHQLQQQQLLQEQQESQVRQMLLEQLLRGQIADPGLQSRLDPTAANNALDKVLLEQQFLHELQRTHHHPRQFGTSVEDISQAKIGRMSQQDQQRELLQLLSRAQHGQISSLEHQILQQEQLLARQSSHGLRQQTNMEEDRHMGSSWPVNDNDHFFRGAATNHRSHPSGINPLDFYQRQQRSSHEDQLNHMQRNPSFQDQLLALYDNASLPFERSLSLPSSGMNRDAANAIARAQALDMQDFTARMQSDDQLGAFSSGLQLLNQQHVGVPSQFLASQLDANEGQWPERIGHQSSDCLESQMQQLRINAERQNRESENQMHAKDLGSWMSGGSENDKSRQLLMELLHQKPSHQHTDSGHMTDAMSFEQRASSTHFSNSSSLDPPFSAIPDQGAALSNPYQSNAFEPTEVLFGNEQVSNMEYKERSPFVSDSGLGFKGHSFLSGVGGATSQAAFADSAVTDDSFMNKEFFDVEGKKHGLNIQGRMKGSFPDVQVKAEQPKLAASVRGDLPTGSHSRHSSTGSASGNPAIYNEKIGHQSFFGEDSAVNKVTLQSKAQNSILLRRPPVPHSSSSSSQEGLSEVIPNALSRTKSSVSSTNGGTMSNLGTDTTESGNRDGHFQRTSSFGEAEMSEPLYLDMLKSNAKKTSNLDIHGTAGGSESSDGAQGSRSGKKKGKKGKQIDPAFLGFKVTSNRIMMGEIQRIED